MTTTLHQLVAAVSWVEVAFALRRYYPNDAHDLERFRRVFDELSGRLCARGDLRLVIRPRPLTSGERWRGEPPAEVGYVEGDGAEPEQQDGIRSLSSRRWAECLGMKVPLAARIAYMDAGVVAHCLREMARFGLEDLAVGGWSTHRTHRRRVDLDEPCLTWSRLGRRNRWKADRG